jgi:VanZ family protein
VTPPPDSHPRLRLLRRLFLLACVLAWAGALTASHIPGPDLPEIHVSDKTLHVTGFLILTTLFWLTLSLHGRRRLGRIAIILLVMPVYAALDELTQPWFLRTADVHDWLADMIGALCALTILELAAAVLASNTSRDSVDGPDPRV